MKVFLETDLPIAAPTAREAIAGVLARLAEASAHGDVALTAAAGTQHRETARLEIPVIIELEPQKKSSEEDVPLTVRARSGSSAFPTFTGWISSVPEGSSLTHVRLRGEYTVPLGSLGAAVNALAFDRIAQESLRRLLVRIAQEAGNNIQERADMDFRAARRGGA